jgi:FlaA1/EpsC-like NDP-sugar epimerase
MAGVQRDAMALNAYKNVKANNKWDVCAKRIVQVVHERDLFDMRCGKDLYIWGAGTIGDHCLRTLLVEHCSISGFIDNNTTKHGMRHCGYTIYPPSHIFDLESAPIIIIAVGMETMSVIYNQLCQMGFPLENVELFCNGEIATDILDWDKLKKVGR